MDRLAPVLGVPRGELAVALPGGGLDLGRDARPSTAGCALLHRFTCFWASLYTWCNPVWRVRVEGREKIRPDATYVMVANHQSFLDILVLFRLFRHFKWVSKIEKFRVPCIGWNMSAQPLREAPPRRPGEHRAR